MDFFINYILPASVGIAFIAFLLFQIFHRTKKEIKPIKKSRLYFAHISNSGTPADEEFRIIAEGKIQPNYLGHNSKGV